MPTKKYTVVFTFWIALVMSMILSVALTVAQGQHVTFGGFGYTFGVAFTASMVFALGLPLGKLAAGFAQRLGAQPGTVANRILFDMAFATEMLIGLAFVVVIALTGLGSIGGMNVFDRAVNIIVTFWPMVFVVTLLIDPLCQRLTELFVSPAKRFVPLGNMGD